MTPERLAEIRKKVSVGVYYSDTLVRELLDHIAQLEAQRGGAVVVPETVPEAALDFIADDVRFVWGPWSEEHDTAVRLYHEWLTKNCVIPADRVLADGMVGVDRKVLEDLREGLQNILDEIPNDEDQGEGYADPVEIQCWKIREAKSALDALRAQQAKRER